jgi:hypothetical protein
MGGEGCHTRNFAILSSATPLGIVSPSRTTGRRGRSIDRARLTPIITTAVERLQDVEGQEGIFVDALVDLDLHLRDVGRADRSLSGRIIAAAEKWMEVASEEEGQGQGRDAQLLTVANGISTLRFG